LHSYIINPSQPITKSKIAVFFGTSVDRYFSPVHNSNMPEIIQKYNITGVSYENLYAGCVTTLNGMGTENLKETTPTSTSKELSATVPSIWGWGGMKLSVKLITDRDGTALQLKGYIAQLSVSPLTKSMDKFLLNLQDLLKQRYNYNFEYERLTKFLPSYKLSINSKDKKAFVVIVLVTFCTTVVGVLFGHGSEAFLGILVLVFGYKFGKKYFYKD